MLLTEFQVDRISTLTGTQPSDWTNVDHQLGRQGSRGASAVAPRWNITNDRGQIVVPFRFHSNYPKKWKSFVVDAITAISTYIKQCIVFVDDTATQAYKQNFIEITCANPETGAFSQGCFSNLGMVGGKQQLSLETPECTDNRMKGFMACMLTGFRNQNQNRNFSWKIPFIEKFLRRKQKKLNHLGRRICSSKIHFRRMFFRLEGFSTKNFVASNWPKL